MIIVGNRNKKTNASSSSKIINLNNANLTPRVVSKQTVKDQFGISDTLLKIKFYCQVDAVKLQTLKNYEKIEFKIAKNNLNYYANIANSTSAKLTGQKQVMAGAIASKNPLANQGRSASNPLGTSGGKTRQQSGSRVSINDDESNFVATSNTKKNPLTIRQLKKSLGKANLFRQNKNANIYKNTTNIGFIDLSKIKFFKTTEKTIEISTDPDRFPAVLEKARQKEHEQIVKGIAPSTIFQKFYLNSMEENKDPIVMFQESFKKSSLNQKRKGLTEKPGLKYNRKVDVFLKMYKSITQRIGSISRNGYQITEKTVSKDFITLSLTVDINLSTLKSLGSEFYVLMFGKNLNGQKIESNEYLVSLEDIEMQLNISSDEYDISSTRTGPGVSILKATNKNKKGKVRLFVEAKTIKRQAPNNFSYYNEVNNFDVLAKNEFLMRDGRLKGAGRNPFYFNASDTIFYRALLGFRDKKYFNCKASVDANPRGFQENLPFCTIIAKNSKEKQSDGITLEIENISSNVVAIRPKRYDYVGNSKGKIKSLINASGKEVKFTYIGRNGTRTSFVDKNVKEKNHYMYVVECLMNNGERKIAPANFIIRYEKRTGTVSIEDIKLLSEDPLVDDSNSLSFDSNEKLNQRNVEITFKVKKVQREVDKILENMFGNLFDLFEDKLKTIRDVQSLIYSIEIIRINNFSGNAATIGKITPDENGFCRFTDTTAPFFESCTYQFLPRVMLASEAIEEVNTQIAIISKKLKRSPINYARASRKAKSYKKRNRIMSIQSGKFNRKRAFTKSIIENEKVVVDRQNFDVFLDSTTGDVFEKKLNSINPQKVPGDIFKVIDPSIKRVINELQNLDASSDKNVLNDEYYDITFQVGGDIFIDFYAIFVKEGEGSKNTYLDGAMHSSDSLVSKKYSYLVKHKGSKGIIEYYAVPFYKNGTVGFPKIITAQVL